MSNRVLIQYTVELTEVPERVSLMLTEVANSFGALSKSVREAATKSQEDPYECVKDMLSIKREFSKRQIRMEELVEILASYITQVKALAEEVAAKQEQESSQKEDSPPAKKKKKKTAKKKTKKGENK